MDDGCKTWNTILTICSVVLVIILVIALAYSDMTTQTETFTGELCSIDDKKIVLCDGTVIFAKNIDSLEWQIGETYNITRESHNTVLDVKIMHIKSIKKEGVKNET